MKKAIFGGSFDPPHKGHLKIIKQALISLDIDTLIIVPAFLNPFKSHSFAPAHLRLKWLEKMTENLDKIEVSSFEVDQNRAVASIETVEHFQDKDEKVYVIIGADNLANLSKWKEVDLLNEKVNWVVASRDGIEIPSEHITLDVNVDISATQLRDKIDPNYLDPSVANEILTYYKDINNG